jgi:glycosyltransferase involved in cell wall biosynthesis
MSTGVPVVCADGGALPELVRDTGIRCRTDEDYVRALRLLIDHPDARQLFGAAGRERIDRLYRWEQCVEGTMSVYREVAGCA